MAFLRVSEVLDLQPQLVDLHLNLGHANQLNLELVGNMVDLALDTHHDCEAPTSSRLVVLAVSASCAARALASLFASRAR